MNSIEVIEKRLEDMDNIMAHCKEMGNDVDADEIMQRITKTKRDLFILKTGQ